MPKKFTQEAITVRVTPNAERWALSSADLPVMDSVLPCVDDLYAFLRKVDDECADAEDSGEFSLEGITRRRGKVGENALLELRKMRTFIKADKTLGECIEHIGTQMKDPVKPTDLHSVMLASELRAFIRSQKSPISFAMGKDSDPAFVGAILNAPPALSGMSDDEVEILRNSSRLKLHPKLARNQDQLRSVHKELQDGMAAAERMISERTGMRLDPDGVVRKTTTPAPLRVVPAA